MIKKNLIALLIMFFSCSICSAATINGTIKFEGTAPHKKIIQMEADPICLAEHKDKVYSQGILLGEGNTLGNVFVYVKSGLKVSNYPVPTDSAVLDQKGCNYSPHVMGVMVGQKVKFLNPDGTLHNVHVMCKINSEFNAAMPDFRKEMEKFFDKPEFMFQIRCDVHPWMMAWMAVMSHPYFSVTQNDGKFEIKNLPAGTYEIEAWQEKLGTKTATVTVADGAEQTVDFTFTSPQ